MAKKLKTIRAGSLVKQVLYTAPEPRDSLQQRAAKSKMTSAARKRMNDKTAKGRLELLMAANFAPMDLVVCLSYRDEDLPKTRAEAVAKMKRFIRLLRGVLAKQGKTMKYIWVTESKHGDGRYHHHMMCSQADANDIELISSLWRYGDNPEIQRVKDRDFDVWAQYFAKEGGDRPLGKQMWRASKGLDKPTVTVEYVPNDTVLASPIDCRIIEREDKQLEFGSYSYIKYYVPPKKQNTGRSGSRPKAFAAPPQNWP